MKFFCSQCRQEFNLEDYEQFKTKENLNMAKVNCPICNLILYRRLDTKYQIGEESKNKP